MIVPEADFCFCPVFLQLLMDSIRTGFREAAATTDFSSCPRFHLWPYANDHRG